MIRRLLRRHLEDAGHRVLTAETADEAMRVGKDADVEVLVADVVLPGGSSGVDLMTAWKEAAPDAEVVLISGHSSLDAAAQAVRHRAFDYLVKPFPTEHLVHVVARAASARRDRLRSRRRWQQLADAVEQRSRELRESRERFQQLIGGLPILVVELDVRSRQATSVGGRLAEIIGCEEGVAYDVMERVHPEERSRVGRLLDAAAQHGLPDLQSEIPEVRLMSPDGEVIWVRFHFSEAMRAGPLCFSCVGVDVTREVVARRERERLEERLSEAQARLRRGLVNSLDLGVGRKPVQIQDTPSPTVVSGADLGVSRAMQEVVQLSEIASRHGEPLLLLGETGTGKGVVAEWVHARSARQDGPFVVLNCSSLGGDMLESELFGHARGAFTSAVRERKGLVEEANGGTLFLDEIGEMSLPAQAKLLRVLEDKTFRRLGESTVRRSDFRLICATNRDLWQDVKAGRFRADLLFRINVLTIPIKPLRQRRDDIPFLAQRLLESVEASHVHLPAETLEVLTQYPWPGNVRELRNALIRATLLSPDAVLRPNHFADLLESTAAHDARRSSLPPPRHPSGEKQRIALLLDRFDGNRSKVAREMGISRTTLYRKLRELGLAPRSREAAR